jgi:hypothetical protein
MASYDFRWLTGSARAPSSGDGAAVLRLVNQQAEESRELLRVRADGTGDWPDFC